MNSNASNDDRDEVAKPLCRSLRLWRFTLAIGFAVWWGGLTFYALIVVPIGTEMLGSVEQGFVTQQVTRALNVIGTVMLILLSINAARARQRAQWLTWIMLVVIQAALFFDHAHLSAALDPATRTTTVPNFYDRHRVYLFLTAAQWACGLLHLWFLLRDCCKGTFPQQGTPGCEGHPCPAVPLETCGKDEPASHLT